MTNDPHQREAAVFDAASQLREPQRSAYLDQSCGGDDSLRQRLLALLRAHENTDSFLDPLLQTPGSETTLPLPIPLAEKPGDKIGRYKLLQQIGEGGCGVVYMAEQEEPVRRRVALKIIKLGMDTKQVIARFEAERQVLAMMDHPNIAKVFDAGVTETGARLSPAAARPGADARESSSKRPSANEAAAAGDSRAPYLSAGRPYFVMELVRGVKITDYCDHNKLPTSERLALFLQVCSAVQHAHQKGIIHRDLKPSNILVTLHDGVPVPKVIDFGIAKATQGRLTDKTIFTAFEQMIGTPAYVSPEQAEMSGLDIDTRSDIYSLGVLLYELLTGKTPFDAKKMLEAGLDAMRRTIREQEPERPSTKLSTMIQGELTTTAARRQTEPPKLIHAIRGDLDWIVMKCLEKDRARRYETANGLATDLQRHLNNEPVVACPPSNLYRFQKMVRRNKLAFAAASAVALSLIIGLGFSTWMFFQEREAKSEQVRLRQQAQANERKAQSEAAKSQQVAQFLQDMLKGVGPSVALGRDTKMLKEILDRTAERIGKDLKDQPEVEAELRTTLGNIYLELDEKPKAEGMFRQALNLRKGLFGETNALVATSLFDLAWVLRFLDTNEAERMYRESLAIRRFLFGNVHRDVGYTLGYLATIIGSPGRENEAEAMFREALDIAGKLGAGETTDAALGLFSLAGLLAGEAKLMEAEKLYRQALAIRRKLLGNESPFVAESLVALAKTLTAEGKFDEAETIENEALALLKKLLTNERWVPLAFPSGPGQVALDPLSAPNKLGELLEQQGRLAEAEVLARAEVARVRKLFEEEHPAVRWAVESLWRLVIQQGKLPEAEAISRDRVERLRTRLPADDPKLADALWRLADSLLNQQRFAEAEPPAREALAIKEKKCPDDWWKFSQRTILGNCLLGQKKYAEAEPLFLSGYEGMKHERKGPKDRQRSSWRALQCLARICELTGRSDEAAKWRGILHREQVEWSKRAGDANDAEALNNLAWLLATSPDPELRDGPRAVESAEKALAATKRRNVRYLGTLAAAYAEAGDFGKAVSTQKEAMALLTDEKTKADFASRLKLYESNTPYREP